MRFPFFRNRDSVKNGILISIRRTGDGFHPGLFNFFFPEQFHTLLIVDKRGINDDTQSTTVLIYIFRNSLYFHNKIKKGPALGRASQHFLLRAFAP